jgi:peroxiredoxin
VLLVTAWEDAGPGIGGSLAALPPAERAVIIGVAAVSALLVARGFPGMRSTSSSDTPDVAPDAADATAKSRRLIRFGHPIGTVAPDFALDNLHGTVVTLQALRATGKPLFFFFSDPDCGPCGALLPDVARWEDAHRDTFTLVVFSRGSPLVNRARFDEYGLTHVLLQREREVAQAYAAWGTPSAVVVRPDGTIGSRLAKAEVEVRRLVAEWTGSESPAGPSGAHTADAQASARTNAPRPTLAPQPRVEPVVTVTIGPDDRPVKHTCVEDELLPEGSIVLYNACSRQFVTLNQTGTLVWECCDGEHDAEAIAAEVRDVFPAAVGVEDDVRAVLDRLLQASMITPVGASLDDRAASSVSS